MKYLKIGLILSGVFSPLAWANPNCEPKTYECEVTYDVQYKDKADSNNTDYHTDTYKVLVESPGQAGFPSLQMCNDEHRQGFTFRCTYKSVSCREISP